MITSRDAAAPMTLILMAKTIVSEGVRACDYQDKLSILLQLDEACVHELKTLPKQMHDSARRHAHQAANKILAPYRAEGMHIAKFGLGLFYAIRELIDTGLYDIESNPAFEAAMSSIISEEGTVTEFANIERLDKSAQKHARRIVTALNSLGYFDKREEVAA